MKSLTDNMGEPHPMQEQAMNLSTAHTSRMVQAIFASEIAPQSQGAAQQSDGEVVKVLFRQLTQSLTVLSSAAELVVERRAGGPSAQRIRVWLQPNARQAEEALHRLREMHLAHTPAATDLIQCLTVLVLAADMIVQGHLPEDHASESYDLLRRNADRAMKRLHELRAQVALSALTGV